VTWIPVKRDPEDDEAKGGELDIKPNETQTPLLLLHIMINQSFLLMLRVVYTYRELFNFVIIWKSPHVVDSVD
jgi:hypothetical protein